MRRIVLSTLLAVSVLGSSLFALSVEDGPFKDVPSYHINSDAISFVKEKGIVGGYPGGNFGPSDLVNRAQFTKIVVDAAFDDEIKGGKCFSDVNFEWYAAHVCFAKRNGIVSGFADGSFGPSKSISFSEAAKIIVSTFDYDYEKDTTPWFKGYVDVLSSKGAIPLTVETFDQPLTRSEMAEIIYRLKSDDKSLDSQSYATLEYYSNKRSGPKPLTTNADVAWRDYYSQQYGIHFKHPPNWFVVKRKDESNLYVQNQEISLDDTPTAPDFIGFEMRFVEDEINVENYIKSGEVISGIEREDIFINGLKIYLYTYSVKGVGNSAEAVWEVDGRSFGVKFLSSGANRKKAIKYLRQFLTTMKTS